MGNTLESHRTPEVLEVIAENIPQLLKAIDQWIVWKAVPKSGGKIGKIPVDPVMRRPINPHDPANHLSFDEAIAAYRSGNWSGVGFDLTGDPVANDGAGRPLYLVGIDFDRVAEDADLLKYAKSVRKRLACYVEVSPSGTGLRMFVLSHHKPRTGQSTKAEIYISGRFLTVTGQNAHGTIQDATEALQKLEPEFWPVVEKVPHSNVLSFPASMHGLNTVLSGEGWPEDEENILRVWDAIAHIPADLPYTEWRNIIWSIASLDWDCGQDLIEEWSATSARHWRDDGGVEAKKAITSLFESYKPSRGITAGTLMHYAYQYGMPRPESRSRSLLSVAHEPTSADNSSGFKLLTRDDLDALPPMRWTVRGVLPETGLAAIYGAPGSGKSFLALDLAARISSGFPFWFGRQVTQRDVVYAALEGGRGIQQRVAAWDAENGARADRIRFFLGGFTLLSDEDVLRFTEAVRASCEPGAVVIIDTLAQATPGADENAGKDMGLVLQAAQSVAGATSGLVILVHHSGKDGSRGLRGHSSLNGAMDAVICVDRDKQTERRSWQVTKMKDADDGATGMFLLSHHDLGDDGFGGRINSGAVKELTGAAAAVATALPKPQGVHQKAIHDVLKAHPEAHKGWNQKALLEVGKTALGEINSRHRATRVKAAIDGLIDGGLLIKDDLGGFHLSSFSPDHPPHAPL